MSEAVAQGGPHNAGKPLDGGPLAITACRANPGKDYTIPLCSRLPLPSVSLPRRISQ